MARITKDYAAYHKDELQAEADARELAVEGTGANGNVVMSDLVAALEDNDTAPNQPPAPLPPLARSNLPVVEIARLDLPKIPGDAPSDDEYSDGVFVETSSGEPFAVCVREEADAVDGKTHFAKNTAHFWNGTAQQFKEQFEKK